jgi:hypothetical protein
MRKPLIPAVVLLASAGLFAFSGCSAPAAEPETEETTSQSTPAEATGEAEAPAGEQTVDESCAIANSALLEVQTEVSDAFSGMTEGDFQGAADALALVQGQLEEASGQVTNPEVKAAIDGVLEDFTVVSEQIAVAASGGAEAVDQEALSTAATNLQEGAQEMQTLCS